MIIKLFKIVFIFLIGSLLVSNHVIKALNQNKISLRVSPSSQSTSQPSNQQFVVTCRGSGAEPPLFSNLRWYDPRGQEIDKTYSERINPDIKVEELEVGSILLHFLNPNPDNSGQYRCSATFQHSDSLETKIQITFYQDVQWEDCPSIQSLVFGSINERIRCKASANPKPSITWSKDDKPLDRRFQIDANGVSILEEINDSFGGVFRVRALVVETGRLHDTFITVQIFKRPEITQLPQRFEGIDNEETTLKCEANGHPSPLFTWLDPNKRNLSSVGGYAVDRNSGALIISRVKQREDSGLFTCVAENEAGSDQKTTSLVVYKRPEIKSFLNQSFDLNKESKLECRSIGDPRPDMSIRRDGDSRPLQNGDPGVSLETNDYKDERILNLIISQTRRDFDGLYFCRATNRAGIAERVGHLEVRFAPDMRRTPLTSVKALELQPINITCIADAIPNATIRWIFRGEYIQNNEIYYINDKTPGLSLLTINSRTQREIFGQYKCLAFNSLGENEIRIQLDRAHRPGPVLQTTHESITPTSVTFRVLVPSFDGGLPITAIHSEYRWESRVERHKWPLDDKELYFLNGLKPRTKYLFRFAAENQIGIGDWSIDREIWTSHETRPSAVQFRNLPFDSSNKEEIISPFDNQFMVNWIIPFDNGKPIKFFEIKYYPVRKTEFGFESIYSTNSEEIVINSVSMTDQSMTSFTLKPLKPNTYYKLEIRANNELGFSDSSYLVFKTADKQQNNDSNDSPNVSLSGSPSLALIAGLAIALIIILLIISDCFFFCRYKVGVIYFLSEHVFTINKRRNEENRSQNSIKSIENRAFNQNKEEDTQTQPFFGRASAV